MSREVVFGPKYMNPGYRSFLIGLPAAVWRFALSMRIRETRLTIRSSHPKRSDGAVEYVRSAARKL